MPAPDPIETALARLMPTSLSVSGQRSIEEMLDGLAGEAQAVPVKAHRFSRSLIGLATAAAIAAVFAVPTFFESKVSATAQVPSATPVRGVEWVNQSDRVESMTDDGWVAGPDGAAMQAVRVRVVGENTLRDRETGYTVRVSEPREEMVLMPVSAF